MPPEGRRGPGWPLLAVLGLGVIALVIAFFAFANPLDNNDEDETITRYAEAEVGQPSRVNPLYNYANEVDRDIASLVFTGLVRLEAD
jgi:hypothetical protein